VCWEGRLPPPGWGLLKDLGVRATFYVDPRQLGEQAEAWRKAYLGGHEIGSGGALGAALDDFTLADLDEALTLDLAEIHRLVGVRPQTFAFPKGRTQVGQGPKAKSFVPLIEDRFLAGVGHRGERANEPWSCRLAELTTVELTGDAASHWQERVDETLEQGGWLLFMGHGEGGDPQALGELCRYLLGPEKGVWVDTVEAIAAHLAHERGEI
jgi:peptidoglycan/xylan/chitin deacetylase (PgdA/CDA1 family)